jgi:glycosyltransferase involved in cell wall biosynthesis
MVLVSHPTGNSFVRSLLSGLTKAGRLGVFATSLGFVEESVWRSLLPKSLRTELKRRAYKISTERLRSFPSREICRLVAQRMGIASLIRHESGLASVDSVYRSLDSHVACRLPQWKRKYGLTSVHTCEDGALATFREARREGLITSYDLPIAYWETSRRLLEAEAERLPEWEPTLVGTQDSVAKLERKTEEIGLSDLVVCPSQFVLDSIPERLKAGRRCIVSQFGSPTVQAPPPNRQANRGRPLRLLFAGSMTQRKGLADLFKAVHLLGRSDVELIVMGSPVAPMSFYREHCATFTYEPPRPHEAVLSLMQSCDVFCLPSIVEGRALVQQEAMSCGLPLLVTANAGGEDLVEEGRTGFLVPIRSPEALAEKIAWLADHREALPEMSRLAREKAGLYTWESYASKIMKALDEQTQPRPSPAAAGGTAPLPQSSPCP